MFVNGNRAHGTLGAALVLVALAFVCAAATSDKAHAATYTVLHTFCPDADYPNCANDGEDPWGTPVVTPDGTVYGTAHDGGAHGAGVLYALVPKGASYRFHVLYHFCAAASCTDGLYPWGRLIIDTKGNVYGVAGGGAYFGGEVFKFAPNASRTGGKLSKIYDFCAKGGSCPDGNGPTGIAYIPSAPGAPYDGKSPLYGGAGGGNSDSGGIVFKLESVKDRTLRRETTLYNFCSTTDCTDGRSPMDASVDAAGDVLGLTDAGGTYNRGVAFKVDSSGKETVLHSICDDQTTCFEGRTLNYSSGGLVLDSAGNLWGEEEDGGANNYGVLFELQRLSAKYKYVKRRDFCSPGTCLDGANPVGGLVADGSGNLFGVTEFGGQQNLAVGGTVFELKGGTHFHTLYAFCAQSGCTDGRQPIGTLTSDSAGNLYGATSSGGNIQPNGAGRGVVFKLTP